jgi:hypothetical protein
LDLSKLSDAELDRLDQLDRLEGLDSVEDMAGRPLGAVIAAVLKEFGVDALSDMDRYTRGPAAESAAPGGRAWTGRAQADDGAEADSLHGNGATGCRDP